MTSNYDIVIVATPLTHDQAFPIEFVGFPNDFIFSGNYQTTYATFVKGNLNPNYFGLEETLGAIMSCNPNKTIINSIGMEDPVNKLVEGNSQVWKIFSKKSVDANLIQKMFAEVKKHTTILAKLYKETNFNIIDMISFFLSRLLRRKKSLGKHILNIQQTWSSINLSYMMRCIMSMQLNGLQVRWK